MSCRRRIANFLARIINNQGVCGCQQRHRGIGLILARIPRHLAGFMDTHIVRDGVGGIVHAARRNHVDGRRRHGQRGVVPGKGHFLANLVV